MKARSIRWILVTAALFGFSACDDGTGPSKTDDVVGEWLWSLSSATAGSYSCDVDNVVVNLTRNDGVLSGTVISNGGGNFTCQFGPGHFVADFVIDEVLVDVSQDGNTLSFAFPFPPGPWVSIGAMESRTSMSGTAAIHVAAQDSANVLTGQWTATRRP